MSLAPSWAPSMQPAPQSVRYHNLRVGRSRSIPFNRPIPNRLVIEAALDQSIGSSRFILVEGAKYQVGVYGNTERDGNFPFWIAAGVPLGRGKVPACSTLFAAAVACLEATAPIVWRGVGSQYLGMMLNSPLEDPFNAPGLMPSQYPWVCGFPRAHYFAMEKEEWIEVIDLVESIAVVLAERGLRAVARAAADGIIPERDEELFIELRDWQE